MDNSVKKTAYVIIFWQLILIIGLALMVFLVQGTQRSVSTLMGGAAYWLPSSIFVWRVFQQTRVQAIKRFVAVFFTGEALKLLLSAVLFIVMIKYLPISVAYAVIGFVGAIVAFWIVAAWRLTHYQQGRGA